MVTKKDNTEQEEKKAISLFDYFRFGESYTSLILGIVVVIIGTVLLLSLVRTRNVGRQENTSSQISMKDDRNSSESATSPTSNDETVVNAVTQKPTSSPTIKPTAIPTKVVKPTSTPTPTTIATKTPPPTATPVPTKRVVVKAKPTITPTKPSAGNTAIQGKTYVVKQGDTLWSIAESAYKSGYNWVDIARANKLSNPDSIKIGAKLVLPKSEQKNATSELEWKSLDASQSAKVNQADKITSNKYTVKPGDNLWTISVRAYGDGYKWVELSKANKLPNPDLIFPGSSFNIPRK